MITKSVLVVEDHEDTAVLIARMLRRYEWSVERVGTLQEGINRANTCPYPEVIILDLSLPDSTVWETISRLHEVMQNGPVIVQSNDHLDDVRRAVEHAGAVFCPKDFGPNYAQHLFSLMVTAVENWSTANIERKKHTSCIDKNLLAMAVVDSAMNAHGR